MSIRNIFLERLFLILQVAEGKNNLSDCAAIFGPDENNETEKTWAARLYVLMTECFSEWISDSLKTKYQKLDNSIYKFQKKVYFNQITGNEIEHQTLDETITHKKSLGFDSLDSRIKEPARAIQTQISIHRNTSLSVEAKFKAFEKLEQLKMEYLNCLFSKNFSYKKLATTQKSYELFYQSIQMNVLSFLEKNKASQLPKIAKIKKDLSFSKFLAPYLSKTNEDLPSSKGLQRIRTTILGFFQAADQEYPPEFLRMINEENAPGEAFKSLKKDVFVIKNDNLFGKRNFEQLYSKQEREALNFNESRSLLQLESNQRNLRTLENNRSNSRANQVSPNLNLKIENLSHENYELGKLKSKLENKLNELNSKFDKLVLVSKSGNRKSDSKFDKYRQFNRFAYRNTEVDTGLNRTSNYKSSNQNPPFDAVRAFNSDVEKLKQTSTHIKKSDYYQPNY